ncbi:hypothetical protein AVEN_3810-1 [Araneus ventricosus]|uniref:Uncharacterized protein n=1 Tax=Araneus ventricosus TaxID=182803 RepID=A0A4Y2HE75_ARAVE|nr:hypothetical protein AVEN_3810-1 [Araneus ventricosus]
MYLVFPLTCLGPCRYTRLRLSPSCNKAYGTNTNDQSSDSPAEKETNRTGWSHPLRPQPHLRLHPRHHNKPATDLPDENLVKKFTKQIRELKQIKERVVQKRKKKKLQDTYPGYKFNQPPPERTTDPQAPPEAIQPHRHFLYSIKHKIHFKKNTKYNLQNILI